jgi:FPC/CPF motif-containing protein YcgG
MQTKIRTREVALQGIVNPMLAEHGEVSEARQYAGREVPTDWECPFERLG